MNTPQPAPQAPPVLSICIPTYNRAAYLDYLLGQASDTWRFSFPYEIVVSDNASPDHTAEVVARHAARGLPIRYFRQAFNKGGGPNCMTAFHRAVGSYIVYLGDDDLLDVDGVEAALGHLRANPELLVLYAPWAYYDPATGQTSGQFFTIAEDRTFHPGQQLDLLGFIASHHIFPEHMIYRADTVRIVLNDPPFCYWAFVYLAHIAACGPVHFAKRPFYRSIGVHPVAPSRSQAGTEQAMTDWDTYRGGLEYFIYILLKRHGISLGEDGRLQMRAVVDAFIHDRMRVAVRLWAARQDYFSAYHLLVRLHHLDPAGTSQIPDVARLHALAANQLLVRFVNGTAEVDRLVVLGERDLEQKRALLLSLGLREDIVLSADPRPGDPAAVRCSVVVIQRDEDRAPVLALGYDPGLVISEAEVFADIHLV